MRLGGVIAMLATILGSSIPASAENPTSKSELAERHAFIEAAMDEQSRKMKAEEEERNRRGQFSSLSIATLVPFGDWDFYYLKDGDIRWDPNPGQTFRSVVVPVGFVTDLASIPRLFWQALRPEGRYAYAAVVHDYLYWTQARPRQEADQIFRIAMEDSKVEPATIEAIYQAVRRLGQAAWDDNTRLKKAGERRLLKRFPSDFTVAWATWKKEPNVFGVE